MTTLAVQPASAPTAPRRRILFFAEAVTLAHVARPITLAQSLDPQTYDVHLAWSDRYAGLFPNLSFATHSIFTIPSAQFTRALARGSPIYSAAELRRYVENDLRIIKLVKPDLIVGDFRLSLAISAAVAGITYAALANAYWSPYAPATYPMPDHPLRTVVGPRIAQCLFNLFRPLAFARYAAPVNKLRREHGLPSLGSDLRRVYTYGDHTLYADHPQMARVANLPPNHHFIGPVLWSPRTPLPPWWDALPADRPIVYINLGSSGDPRGRRLPAILDAVAGLDLTAIVATAGAPPPPSVPANAFITDYLPGDLACGRADLVICNGGSPATQQALAAGRPIVAVPSNLDQLLNMQAIERLGVGVTVRASRRLARDLRAAVVRSLADAEARRAAEELQRAMADFAAGDRFAGLLASLTAGRAQA